MLKIKYISTVLHEQSLVSFTAAQDNTIAIVVGTVAGVLLVALIVVLLFYVYTRRSYKKYKSSEAASSVGRTSRSSSISGEDVLRSRDRLVLDLNRSRELLGVSHDDMSTIDSDDDQSLTEEERERIQHIARAMKKMPQMNVSSAIFISNFPNKRCVF